MTEDTWRRIEHHLAKWPEVAGGAIDIDEVNSTLAGIPCTAPSDFREFLCRYGGAMIGAIPIFGLRPVEIMGNAWSIVENNQWFRQEGWPDVDDLLIFSEDQAGNPFGFRSDGAVWRVDHDLDETEQVAEDFEDFLRTRGLKAPRL